MSHQSHSVQFYKDDTFFFKESVTRFIKEGLQGNETVIIVATARHREELQRVLTQGGGWGDGRAGSSEWPRPHFW